MLLELKNTTFQSITNEIWFIQDISLHPYSKRIIKKVNKNVHVVNFPKVPVSIFWLWQSTVLISWIHPR